MTPQGAFAGSCGAPPHASPYGKGRCRAGRDGGDKKAGKRDGQGRDDSVFSWFGNRTNNPSVSYADSSLCTREPWKRAARPAKQHTVLFVLP